MITTIKDLVDICTSELQIREYRDEYAADICAQWDSLMKWMDHKQYSDFNENIGLQYCDETVGTHLTGKELPYRSKLILRAIHMLISYQKDGEFSFRTPSVERRFEGSHLEYELPEYLNEYQRILSIRAKKAPQPVISYVKEDAMKAILDEVDLSTPNGLRDFVILAIMYSSGVRVSEIIKIKVKDVTFSEPASILVHGKGQKSRYIPIFADVKPYLERYISIMNYDQPTKENEYLFKNHMKLNMTRQGVDYIVKKYSKRARDHNPGIGIPEDFSCHKIRHSTAMGMVDEGVDLIYIRDLLGHVSVKTTEVYAKASSKKKREAIEAAASHITPTEEPEWEKDVNLKEWLKSFNKIR